MPHFLFRSQYFLTILNKTRLSNEQSNQAKQTNQKAKKVKKNKPNVKKNPRNKDFDDIDDEDELLAKAMATAGNCAQELDIKSVISKAFNIEKVLIWNLGSGSM